MPSVFINQENGEEHDNAANVWEPSKIKEYFSCISVFITGATGFIGKLLLEKLLRTCLDVKMVYILVRTKKGKNVEERYQELLNNMIFDGLKADNPSFTEKITLMEGDCSLPDLGLSDKDKQTLFDEISCVFHCAATVRFDETIRSATYMNVRATRDILAISRKMKNLTSFIYMSTAYSHCVRKEIGEEIYEPRITGEKLLTLVEVLDEDLLKKITPILIGEWPNTYSFSKAVAEEVVKSESKGLPVAVVRPTIVISTVKEPLPGWIDNMYGATGMVAGVGMGLIHTINCIQKNLSDMVPADYVVSCTIAAAWNIGLTHDSNKMVNSESILKEKSLKSDIPVYNYVSSTQKPLTWEELLVSLRNENLECPTVLGLWYPFVILTSSRWLHAIYVFFLHIVPAHVVDIICYCIGKKPMLVKGYKKIHKFMDVLAYFSTREWRFQNNNTQALWKKMNPEDRKNFNFDMDAFDWGSYFYVYLRGGRMHLLKDSLDTIPQGKAKYFRLKVAHYALTGFILLVLLKLLMDLWNVLFSSDD